MTKSKYYDGFHRIWRDGVPCRVAPWVKDLTPIGKDSLLRGSNYRPSQKLHLEAQQMRHAQTTYSNAAETH